MNIADARAYRERWREVAKIESQEAQALTIQERWLKLNALKGRAARLGITRKKDEGEMEIFLLWAKLRITHVSA